MAKMPTPLAPVLTVIGLPLAVAVGLLLAVIGAGLWYLLTLRALVQAVVGALAGWVFPVRSDPAEGPPVRVGTRPTQPPGAAAGDPPAAVSGVRPTPGGRECPGGGGALGGPIFPG